MSTISLPPAEPEPFYKPESYNPDVSVGHLMRTLLACLSQEIERELEPSGLTNAQWKPLFTLALGRAFTVAELARTCQLDAGGTTRLLDRLEAKGFCKRLRSLEDRRVVNVELTDAGREAAKAVPIALSRVQNAHLAGFSADEVQMLTGFLRRMLDNANAIQAQGKNNDEAL